MQRHESSSPDAMIPRLYIFDADNTLRRTLVADRPCPRAPEEWELLPGVREKMRTIDWSSRGPFLGIASNQDQVGYGLFSAAMAERLLHAMVMAAVGAIDLEPCIRFCPHRPDEPCNCRKPAPGMLLSIMEHFSVSPDETIFVGDAQCDEVAAKRAGVSFIPAREFFLWR